MADVVVIGAGVAGLSVATFLGDRHRVKVVDPDPGGKVRTLLRDGFRVENAANGWLDSEPAMTRLLAMLGLQQQVVQAAEGTRWLARGEGLIPLPKKPPQILKSPLLSWSGKLRALADVVMPRGPAEETIAAFVRRRLGQEVLDTLVAPMVAGIHSGDTEALSVEACFPRLKALEREHRSLLMAVRAERPTPGKLTSMTMGAGVLTQTMVDRLDIERTRCVELKPGWTVVTEDGVLAADAVVLACPGHVAKSLLSFDDTLPSLVGSIPYAPIATVSVGLPRWDEAPEGFGLLVPPKEGRGILGTLFESNSFPNRAPKDHVLLRTMLGGALNPLQARLERRGLIEAARRENERLLGPLPDAVMTEVRMHAQGIPQYLLSHPQRVRSIEERVPERLFLTGNHLRGVAVKDCVRDAERIAEAVDAAV